MYQKSLMFPSFCTTIPAFQPPTHEKLMNRTCSSRMLCLVLAVVFCRCTTQAAAADAQSLHQRINQLLQAQHVGPPLAKCSDAEFLRRVYLDLTGRIPTAEQARQFLDDAPSDKRVRLVDQLLSSSAYAEHMATVFDVVLMERRADKHVKADPWREYLLTSFRENKPYSKLAAEILGADGVDAAKRAPAKFLMDRDLSTDLLTRDVGRIFFGMDLECAQCHDHPLVDDYYQADYYGIYAFFNRSYIFQPDKKKPAVIAEKAEGDVKFKSVFTGDEGNTRPRLPGEQQIEEPTFKKGEAYQVKPDPKKKNIRPVPKYSRQQHLAKLIQEGKNVSFRKNIANRLWAHMIGRGLVDPVDFHHGDNPASHPELLKLLADEFAASGFDIKAMLRGIALSDAYQRPFRVPADLTPFVAEAKKLRPSLSEEVEQAKAELPQLKQQVGEVIAALAKSNDAVKQKAAEKEKADEVAATAETAFNKAAQLAAEQQQKLATSQAASNLLGKAVSQAQNSAKLLANDKELAAVVAQLQTTSRQQASNVAAFQKAATEADAKKQTAESRLTATRQAVSNSQKQLALAREEVAQLEDRRSKLEDLQEQNRQSIAAAQSKLVAVDQLVAYDEANQNVKAVRTALANASSELSKANAAVESAKQQLATHQQSMAALQKELGEKTAAFERLKVEMTARNEAKPLLEDALASARQAANVLGDDELTAVTQQLEGRTSQLQGEVAALEQSIEREQLALAEMNKRLETARSAYQDATAKAEAAKQGAASASEKVDAAKSELGSKTAGLETRLADLTETWTKSADLATLEPLSPEQLAWSIMQISGLIDRQRTAEAAALNKKTPLSDEDKKNPAKVAARERQIDKAVYAKLKANVAKFVKLFGAGAGQPQNEFFATVDQALFFANGGEVQSWLRASSGNLTDRLTKIEDAEELAEELYLGVLTRRPSKQEIADVAGYLATSGLDKKVAVQEMAWALLTSAEFRFQR